MVLAVLGILTGGLYALTPPLFFWGCTLVMLLLLLTVCRPVRMLHLTVFFLALESVNLTAQYKGVYNVRYYPYMVLAVLSYAGCLIHKVRLRESFTGVPATPLFYLIVAMEMISILWSPQPAIGGHLAICLVVHLLLYITIINTVDSTRTVRAFTHTWLWSGLVVSVCVVLSQYWEVQWNHHFSDAVTLNALFQKQTYRPAGVGGAINIGGFLGMTSMLALGYICWEKTWRRRVPYVLAFLLILHATILTLARGAILSMIGAFAFFVIMHEQLRKYFLSTMVAFVFLLVAMTFLSNPAFVDRILVGFGYQGELMFTDQNAGSGQSESELLASGSGLSGFDIRNLWWKNALREMAEHPVKYLTGLGMGGFIYYSQFYDTVTSPEVNSYHFSFFFDFGLIGVMLYLVFVVMVGSYILKALRTGPPDYLNAMLIAVTAGMIADTVIYGLIDNDLTSYGARYFWFPLAFNLAVARLAMHRPRETAI